MAVVSFMAEDMLYRAAVTSAHLLQTPTVRTTMQMLGRMIDQPFYFLCHSSSSSVSSSSCDSSSIFVGVPVVRMGHTSFGYKQPPPDPHCHSKLETLAEFPSCFPLYVSLCIGTLALVISYRLSFHLAFGGLKLKWVVVSFLKKMIPKIGH